jgi:microsomal dipeptidase-like Zn-dependent dipeptidase
MIVGGSVSVGDALERDVVNAWDGSPANGNCRSLVPGDRQLTDEQIKALIERNAVIGASFDCWMIVPGWKNRFVINFGSFVPYMLRSLIMKRIFRKGAEKPQQTYVMDPPSIT